MGRRRPLHTGVVRHLRQLFKAGEAILPRCAPCAATDRRRMAVCVANTRRLHFSALIHFTCIRCRRPNQERRTSFGRAVKCGVCGGVMDVPAAGPKPSRPIRQLGEGAPFPGIETPDAPAPAEVSGFAGNGRLSGESLTCRENRPSRRVQPVRAATAAARARLRHRRRTGPRWHGVVRAATVVGAGKWR